MDHYISTLGDVERSKSSSLRFWCCMSSKRADLGHIFLYITNRTSYVGRPNVSLDLALGDLERKVKYKPHCIFQPLHLERNRVKAYVTRLLLNTIGSHVLSVQAHIQNWASMASKRQVHSHPTSVKAIEKLYNRSFYWWKLTLLS